jgi:hypothetical protein
VPVPASLEALAGWMASFLVLAITLQLIRVAMDLIQVASDATSPPPRSASTSAPVTSVSSDQQKKETVKPPLYGSMTANDNNDSNNNNATSTGKEKDEERTLLLSNSNNDDDEITGTSTGTASLRARLFLASWIILTILFITAALSNKNKTTIFPQSLVWSAAAVTATNVCLWIRDPLHVRYGSIQRFFHLTAVLSVWIVTAVLMLPATAGSSKKSLKDTAFLCQVTVVVLITILQAWFPPTSTSSTHSDTDSTSHSNAGLSRKAILPLLKPYFWPDATDSTALRNRARAIATWFCVIGSKACNLSSPLLLGWASTALAHQDYRSTIKYVIGYSVISLAGSTLKEGQSLVYLKVAQAAFVQLSETAFGHLHNLSLDWHLRKKLGEVLRSMDRGIAACDTLMKYLFLWLIPALVECIVVCIIFATYFRFLPLAVAVFYFVFGYIVWTILVTLWRKKFRKELVKSDNGE